MTQKGENGATRDVDKRWFIVAIGLVAAVSLLATALNHFRIPDVQEQAATGLEIDLKTILNRASDYYRILDEMSVYYYCSETLIETIYPIPKKYLGIVFLRDGSKNDWWKIHLGPVKVKEYLYDYQMLRSGKKVKERRTLLRENGVEKLEKNTDLKTKIFEYQTVGFGASAFDQEESENYDFQLKGWDTVNGTKAILVESKPHSGTGKDLIWGKYWIDPVHFGFIRAELAQHSIGNFQILEKKSLALQATPQVVMVVDYGIEHGNIRFPSHFFIEEGYQGRDNERIVLSSIEVFYRDYKFFKVEVQVKENK